MVALVRDGVSPGRTRKPFCEQALQCVALLAQAVGHVLTPYLLHGGLIGTIRFEELAGTRVLILVCANPCLFVLRRSNVCMWVDGHFDSILD